MTYYLLLIYPISLLVIYLYHCERADNQGFVDKSLSREQSKMLQGISCLFIVLHHLSQAVTSYGDIYKGPITLLSSMGILFTSVFFFFSGYGLIISVKTNENYLDNFLKHRLSTILVPFFIANTIAVLIRIYYLKIPMTMSQILKCVFGYVLINGNGWYIVEIFFIYIAFYLLFKLIKNKYIATILLCVFTVFLIYIGYSNGHDYSTLGDHWFKGEWWYNSTIVFVLGVIFACFKDVIFAYIKKHYTVLITLFSVLFVLSFYIEEIIRKRYGYYQGTIGINNTNPKLITLISQMILCLIFMILVILIHMKINPGNKVLKFFSSISMELFLLHGLFINNIFNLSRRNEFFSFALVLCCGILSATLMHEFDKRIIGLINKKSTKKEYLNLCEKDLIRERREKKLKKAVRFLIIIATALITVFFVWQKIVLRIEYKNEINTLAASKEFDTVKFGRYDSEPSIIGNEKVEWIVLKKQDEKVMLVTKYGIEGATYNKKHTEVSFTDSDIYSLLNNDLYEKLFSDYEKKIVLQNPDDGGYVSLLSPQEVNKYFSDDKSKELLATKSAQKKGVNVNTPSKINSWDYKDYRTSWWWLKGEKGITAPIVNAEGIIELDKKNVNRPNGAVRPVIWVNIK